jgi:hypothetical protein
LKNAAKALDFISVRVHFFEIAKPGRANRSSQNGKICLEVVSKPQIRFPA